MKDKTTHLYVDSHERTLILHSLVELKNALIRQGRYTDCIDEPIFKVVNAPVKKMKIEYVYPRRIGCRQILYGKGRNDEHHSDRPQRRYYHY